MNLKPTLLASIVGVSLFLSPYAMAQKLTTLEQKASYSIGVELAQNLKNQGIELHTVSFLRGLEDTLLQRNLQLNAEEMAQAIEQFRATLEQKQQAKFEQLAKENAQKGLAFLNQNKTKAGIKTTDSGLQYRVIQAGSGKSPNETDKITAHYRGTLIDGTEFDSSYNRGAPIEFELAHVIQGWQEAIKLMQPGAKWEIFVPAELAYGARGAGNVIGPNETLIFEIELIGASAKE
ncbi:MAG: FKBP-type peptidyl-prolyl cis-trans isomerase [Thiomicrospira sp.]|jgi:FKBP-type peptidyl-prolyl cis-trans isomerase FklB|nr:FKBP-type peptidyl-prolyl cis-trans isomerase [Thiomicrospira sp.]